MEDKQLYHWGIKGQRWGVRRWQNKDGSLTPAGKKRYDDDNGRDGSSEDSKRAHDTTKKVGDMDDNELRSRINRLQMEEQYAKLMTPPPSTIQKVGSWLGGIAKESAKDIIKNTATEWGKAYIDSWIGVPDKDGNSGLNRWVNRKVDTKISIKDKLNSFRRTKKTNANQTTDTKTSWTDAEKQSFYKNYWDMKVQDAVDKRNADRGIFYLSSGTSQTNTNNTKKAKKRRKKKNGVEVYDL